MFYWSLLAEELKKRNLLPKSSGLVTIIKKSDRPLPESAGEASIPIVQAEFPVRCPYCGHRSRNVGYGQNHILRRHKRKSNLRWVNPDSRDPLFPVD